MRAVPLIGAALVAALAFALWTPTTPDQPTSAAPAGPALAGAWDLDWQATTRQIVGGEPVESRLALRGQIGLSRVDAQRFALRFTRIDSLAITVAGAAQPAPGAPLVGPVLVFERDARGAPLHFATTPNAPPGFAHLATAAARRMSVLDAQTTEEITPIGVATIVVDGARRTRSYRRVQGVAGAPSGTSEHHLAGDTLRDTEALTAPDFEASVAFVARRSAVDLPPPDVARLTAHQPAAVSDRAKQRRLEEQAAGLDRQRLLDTLRGHLAMGSSPSSRWLWQAVGRLRLEPALAAEIGRLIPRATPFGQALIADLLASAGHPAAQAALRDALAHPDLRAAPVQRARLLQRLGFVKRPTPETVAWVADQAADDDVRVRRAAHLTRGGIARRVDDPAPILAALTAATEAADPEEARAALAGLGNSAQPEAAPTLLAHADAADHLTRRTVAQALRSMPAVDDTLVGLSTDPVDTVQQAALAALGQRALDGRVADGLRAGLASGAIGDPQRNQVLGLAEQASRGEGAGATWRPVLEALLRRAEGDPRLAARVRRLLRERT